MAPTPYRLKTKLSAPPLAQAASLALGLMRAAKVTRWADIGNVMPAMVELSDDEYGLILEHFEILSFLRLPSRLDDGTSTRTVTVAVCPTCGEWVLVSTGPVPGRCEITRGCTGRPVKASVATKASAASDTRDASRQRD